MKIYELRLKFYWSMFLRVQLTIFPHWFRQWLGNDQATSHYLKQWWLVYWRTFASLGLNELTQCPTLPIVKAQIRKNVFPWIHNGLIIVRVFRKRTGKRCIGYNVTLRNYINTCSFIAMNKCSTDDAKTLFRSLTKPQHLHAMKTKRNVYTIFSHRT